MKRCCLLLSGLIASGCVLAAAAPQISWPQAQSDLPADPAVRFGALANGMRYAITKNATPRKEVSLRLRIGAGSLNENDAQQGLAHFLEHMAFRGSTHIPDGEVKNRLERLGLKFGADINAFTAPTQTVYTFDLPRNDQQSLDSALLILREMCSQLLLKTASLDAERGVVLSEARLRDTPGFRMSVAQQELLMHGQLAPTRMPIGKVAVVQNATAAQLRDFYQTYYRPERATLIVVGDVDIKEMEARIRSQFGDWRNPAPDGPTPNYGAPLQRGTAAAVFAEVGAPSTSLLAWVAPYDATPDTLAHERRDLIEQVALAVLNTRLQTAAAAADHAFSRAGVFRQNELRSAKIATLAVQNDPGHWQQALAAADQLRRQILQQGVQQAEVDRAVADLRTSFQVAAAGAATRESTQIASEILGNVDEDGVYTGPARDVLTAEYAFKELKLADVDAALRAAFQGSGPLAFVASPEPVVGGESALLGVVAAAEQGKVETQTTVQEVHWPYTDFGAPGLVAETQQVRDLDLTQVRFANGVLLTVKPTKYSADQILISARVGSGRLDLPPGRPTALWAEAGMVSLAGLGKLDLPALEQVFAGKSVGVHFQLADDAFVYAGATRAADLTLQLQLMTAQIADPGWRPEVFEQVRSSTLNQLSQVSANAGAVYGTHRDSVLRRGDPRWAVPETSAVREAHVEELPALLAAPLAHGPIELTVVGDVAIDRVVAAVAASFGALPARTLPHLRGKAGEVSFAAATAAPVVLEHQGGEEQGIAAAGWPTTDAMSDLKSLAARSVLGEVLQERLFAELRQRLSTSYSPQVSTQSSNVFPGYGSIVATADIPPARASQFFDGVTHIAADLAATAISGDELDRVRNPAVEKLQQAQQNNGYWLAVLAGSQSEPHRLEQVRQALPNLKAVTAADVQAAARTYLHAERQWQLIVQKPKSN